MLKLINYIKEDSLTPLSNGGKGLLSRLLESIRERFLVHFEKRVAKLQLKAVTALERLQDYVSRQITPTTDPILKEKLEKIHECIDSLKKLLSSVESQVSEAKDKLPKIPNISESKVSEDSK